MYTLLKLLLQHELLDSLELFAFTVVAAVVVVAAVEFGLKHAAVVFEFNFALLLRGVSGLDAGDSLRILDRNNRGFNAVEGEEGVNTFVTADDS